MISEYKIGEFTWIDLDSPTKDEINKITEDFKINFLAAKDMSSPTPHPKAYNFGNHLYTVMHIPVFKHSHNGKETFQEIDFLVGEKFLITARYDAIDALNTFTKTIEVGQVISKDDNFKHPFFGLTREMHKSICDELAWSEDWISEIEEKIFSGMEKEMVMALSQASRNVLSFRKTIASHQGVLSWIMEVTKENWSKEFNDEMKTLWNSAVHINGVINNQKYLVDELRETNNSLLSTKENEIIKVLTILALIALPASIIASIFNMNTNLPLADNPNNFYIVICIMAISSLLTFSFFKIKKWL